MKPQKLTVDEIRKKLFSVFDSAPVYKAVLFGSYARGEETEDSDIDIVIDSNNQLLNIYFYGVLENITQALGRKVDLFEISEIKPGSPIFKNIQREGVLLYEKKRQDHIPEGYRLYQ
ncbi:MAG: nucleotidyltransferase domain-containing protein [Oscillospiraceae bacterium]|nr:nucleotidyltransferase domain-containing protein [Oscillospiraceae bacterium]